MEKSNRVIPIIVSILAISYAYAIIRYHIFKGIDWQFLPLYTTNKAIALSSVLFICLSYLLGPLGRFDQSMGRLLPLRKPLGLTGFTLAVAHSVISLTLLDPYYYPSLYVSGRFNLFSQLHLLSGVLGIVLFSLVAVSSIPSVMQTMESTRWRAVQRIGYWGLFTILIHIYTVGVRGWIDPTTWPGGLFPISLIAFICIMFVFTVKVFSLFFRHERTP